MQEETDIMPVRQYLELGPYNGPPIDDKFLSDLNKLTQKQRFECLSCTPDDVLDAITKYSPDISCSGCIRTLKESLTMGVLPHGERVSELLRAMKDGSISLHPHLARDTTSTARVFALCHKPGYLGSRCGTKRNRCSIHAANPRVEHGWHTLWEMMPLPIKMNTAFLRLQDIQDSLGKHLKGLFLCRDCRGNVLKAMDLLKGVVDPRDIPLDEVHDRLCFQPFRKLYFGTCVDRIGQALHEHNNRPSVSHTLAHVGEHVLQGAVEDDDDETSSQEGAHGKQQHQHGHAQQQHPSNESNSSSTGGNSPHPTTTMTHSSGHSPHGTQQHTQQQPKNRNKKQKTMEKKEVIPDGTGLPQLEEGDDEDDEDDYDYEDEGEDDEYERNHDCCQDGCCGDEEHEHEYEDEEEEHDDDCCCSEDCVECCAEAGELPLSLSSQWPFNVPDTELMPTSSPWLWDMDSTTTAINAGTEAKQVVPKAMGWGGGCVHGSDMTVLTDDDGADVSVVRACGCAATHIAVALDYVPTLIASALEADERDELARSKGLSSDRHAPTVKDGQFELVNCIGKVLLSRMRDAWVRSLETKQTELMLLWLALDCMRTNVEHVMHQSALTELLEEEENEVGKAERARTKKKRKKKAKSDRVAAAVAEALTKAEKEADDEAERKRELKESKKKKNKNNKKNKNGDELVKSLAGMNLDSRVESDMNKGPHNSKYSTRGWSQEEEDRVLSQMGWLDENQATAGSSSSSSSTSSSSPGTSNDKPSALAMAETKNAGLFGGGSDLFATMSSDTSDDLDHPEHDEGDEDGDDGSGGLTMEELREAKAKLQNMTVGTIGSSREELRAKLRRRFESLCK